MKKKKKNCGKRIVKNTALLNEKPYLNSCGNENSVGFQHLESSYIRINNQIKCKYFPMLLIIQRQDSAMSKEWEC